MAGHWAYPRQKEWGGTVVDENADRVHVPGQPPVPERDIEPLWPPDQIDGADAPPWASASSPTSPVPPQGRPAAPPSPADYPSLTGGPATTAPPAATTGWAPPPARASGRAPAPSGQGWAPPTPFTRPTAPPAQGAVAPPSDPAVPPGTGTAVPPGTGTSAPGIAGTGPAVGADGQAAGGAGAGVPAPRSPQPAPTRVDLDTPFSLDQPAAPVPVTRPAAIPQPSATDRAAASERSPEVAADSAATGAGPAKSGVPVAGSAGSGGGAPTSGAAANSGAANGGGARGSAESPWAQPPQRPAPAAVEPALAAGADGPAPVTNHRAAQPVPPTYRGAARAAPPSGGAAGHGATGQGVPQPGSPGHGGSAEPAGDLGPGAGAPQTTPSGPYPPQATVPHPPQATVPHPPQTAVPPQQAAPTPPGPYPPQPGWYPPAWPLGTPGAAGPAPQQAYQPAEGVTAVPPTQPDPGWNPAVAAPPTAEDFARRRQVRPADPVATMGVRAVANLVGLRLPPGRHEQELRRDIEMVRRNFGGLRQVTVVNPKGGAGKTVAILLLAMTFGQKRGGYVLAWDNNETQGTLGMRAQQDFHSRTVRDMLRDLGQFQGAHGRVGDLSQYVRSQGEGMFDVLASDESATGGEMLTAAAFAEIREVVSRFYKLIFVDTGNNVRAQNWQAAMDATDQLVVTMSARNDSAETAARMLDHLEQSGRQRLVRQAVTVVSMPPSRKEIDLPAIQEHFAARTRAVLLAPYERLIDTGEPIRYAALSSATRDAWLKIAASVAEGL
ncbi:chromosome partitioning protein [Micromonospora sp. NPDC048063]|uniref:MinD/ParA family ATP-binding protein n=1 Tax=Micromonospora sp. NPDC048063 TaxID=3364256 RepID=UPI003716E1BD